MRQLVYRVLDLPPSMRPLVYDFGQLTTRTEEDYTKQIVFDHVSILVCNSTGNVIKYHIIISCAASCHFSALDITMLCAFFALAVPDPGIPRHCLGKILVSCGYCLQKLVAAPQHVSPAWVTLQL